MLKELGLESWLKTTSGKGLHVAVPLKPEHDYPTVTGFPRARGPDFSGLYAAGGLRWTRVDRSLAVDAVQGEPVSG
jgi:LigD-like primase-polymerase